MRSGIHAGIALVVLAGVSMWAAQPLHTNGVPGLSPVSLAHAQDAKPGDKPADKPAEKPSDKPADKPESGAKSGDGPKPGGPGGPGGGGARGPMPVEAQPVKRLPMRDILSAAGQFRAAESVMIRPEISGRIAKLYFTDGQSVKAGSPLLQLDASVNDAEIAQARAEIGQLKTELELARANLRRNEDLAAQKFISERVRDESAAAVAASEAKIAVSEAKLQLAQSRASKMLIRAPFSGTVGLRNVSVGDYLKDGTDVVLLEDRSTIKLDFRVPEKSATKLRKGQKVQIRADALPGDVLEGVVEAFDSAVDANGRMLTVRAKTANPNGSLRAGMFAKVDVVLAERPQALVVPEESILPQGQDLFVFRVVDGKAVRTKVKLGLRREGKAEIVQGVNETDLVVTSGQAKMRGNEVAVKVLEARPGGGGKPQGAADAATR